MLEDIKICNLKMSVKNKYTLFFIKIKTLFTVEPNVNFLSKKCITGILQKNVFLEVRTVYTRRGKARITLKWELCAFIFLGFP